MFFFKFFNKIFIANKASDCFYVKYLLKKMFIFRILNTVPYTNRTIVKDVIACVHSYFTCNLLIGLAILLSYKQFGGYPIECMTPMGFSSAWNEVLYNNKF